MVCSSNTASHLSPSVQTRTRCYLFVASLERIVNGTGGSLWDDQSCYHPAPYKSHLGDMAMQSSFGEKAEIPKTQNSCCRQWCGTLLFEVKIFATLMLPIYYQCNNGRVGSLWLNRFFFYHIQFLVLYSYSVRRFVPLIFTLGNKSEKM